MITMLYEKTLSRKVITIKPSTNGIQIAEDGESPTTKNTKPGSTMWNWSSMIQKVKGRSANFRNPPRIEVVKQPASTGKILSLMRQVIRKTFNSMF